MPSDLVEPELQPSPEGALRWQRAKRQSRRSISCSDRAIGQSSVQTDAGGNDVIKLCTLTPLTTIPDIEAFKTQLGG